MWLRCISVAKRKSIQTKKYFYGTFQYFLIFFFWILILRYSSVLLTISNNQPNSPTVLWPMKIYFFSFTIYLVFCQWFAWTQWKFFFYFCLCLYGHSMFIGSLALARFWSLLVSKKIQNNAVMPQSLIVLTVLVVNQYRECSRAVWPHNIAWPVSFWRQSSMGLRGGVPPPRHPQCSIGTPQPKNYKSAKNAPYSQITALNFISFLWVINGKNLSK